MMQIAGSNEVVQHVATPALVQLVCAGDVAAACELIGRHKSLAYRTSFAILKNREDAEDAVQEASLRVFQKISCFEGKAAFTTWFTSIVINTCLMQLRRRRTRPTCSLEEIAGGDSAQSLMLSHPGASPEEECHLTEMERLLRTAINDLPMRLRATASDRFVKEMPITDLAQRHGITRTAAKSRVFRARKIIEDTLRPAC